MASGFVLEQELQHELGATAVPQAVQDDIPTFWIAKDELHRTLHSLRYSVSSPYTMLYDLSAIDERGRKHRDDQPQSSFTGVYHLYSYDRNSYLRLKVALDEDHPTLPTITDL